MEVRPGQPLRFLDEGLVDADVPDPPPALRAAATQVGAMLKAYREAGREMLEGPYSEISELAPVHLREPCDITAICCTDGIIVRRDRGTEGETKVRAAAIDDTITKLAPALSDTFVHVSDDPGAYDPGEGGVQFAPEKVNFETGETELLNSVRLIVVVTPNVGDLPATPKTRPQALLSMTNELQVVVEGVMEPANPESAGNVPSARQFVATGPMTLKVGWQSFEIYQPFDADYWNPQFAASWAETDLLAAVARRHLAQSSLTAIDPNVAARKEFARILAELEQLLEGPEEPAHQYLKRHPEILCPAHIAAWSKLPLGDHVTDFVFRQVPDKYLFVEIESPLRRIFRKDGQQRQELTHAINQILDWRVYIEDNLGRLQKEAGLVGLSSNPESLVVIGRADELSVDNRRKIVALENQVPNLRVLTYDDLIAHARAVADNLYGPMGIVGNNVDIYYFPPRA